MEKNNHNPPLDYTPMVIIIKLLARNSRTELSVVELATGVSMDVRAIVLLVTLLRTGQTMDRVGSRATTVH